MKQVLDSLKFLENRKIVLGLKQGTCDHGVGSIRRVPTTSLVDETKICGRDDDKEMIIDWLLSDNNDNGSHFSVISIVGMGGLGKTTLAQLVYNDRRVKDSFDIEAWICVSDDFDELTKRRIEAKNQTPVAKKVRFFYSAFVSSFDKDIESRMKLVLDRLEYLKNRNIVQGLKQGTGGGHGVGLITKVPTTSLVDETRICGRDHDKEMVINWLLSDNHIGSNFSVISIAGMGGLGKTTLAQLVYNDQRMKHKFDLKAWVCVSNEFDVLRVTRTIFEAVTNSNDDTKDLNMLQIKLTEKLSQKKFLLILDDVWNEGYMLWETLQTPLHHGASGSKILVTTRSNRVASTMRSAKRHSLKLLTEEDSWRVFKRFAFHNRDVPYSYSDLEEVGRKISTKCKGLSLALKMIGSLLYTKLSSKEWNGILKSEIWNEETDTLPALILSYHYLPSHLKRCFAFFSMYPKDYEFPKEHLVQLWMAENIRMWSSEQRHIICGRAILP